MSILIALELQEKINTGNGVKGNFQLRDINR